MFLACFVFPNLAAAETWHLTFCRFMLISIKLPGCPERNPASCLCFSKMEWPEAARMGDVGLRTIYEYLTIFSSESGFFSFLPSTEKSLELEVCSEKVVRKQKK